LTRAAGPRSGHGIGVCADDDLLRRALAPLAQADQGEVLRNDGTFVVAAQMGEWLSGQVRDRRGIITLAAHTFRDGSKSVGAAHEAPSPRVLIPVQEVCKSH
jgi:hypothetical protein